MRLIGHVILDLVTSALHWDFLELGNIIFLHALKVSSIRQEYTYVLCIESALDAKIS